MQKGHFKSVFEITLHLACQFSLIECIRILLKIGKRSTKYIKFFLYILSAEICKVIVRIMLIGLQILENLARMYFKDFIGRNE